MGFFEKIKNAFSRKSDKQHYLSGFKQTSRSIHDKLSVLSNNYTIADDAFLEALMIVLIQSDIGVKTSQKIVTILKKKIKNKKIPFEEVLQLLYESMAELYGDSTYNLKKQDGTTVIFLVGINGSGKTTTAAKLANMFKEQGLSVALTAADTFRAGAIEQLKRWADRLELPCVMGRENGDPAAAIVDGCRYAKEHQIDILLCDTAGRLQNKTNLMNELKKMTKVAGKEIENAPHAVWLVLDSTTGQNGLSQAEVFLQSTPVDGIILTKMDGTSKGGIILAIKDQLQLPVVYVGCGETLDALREFDLNSYIYSIAEGMTDAAE